MEGTPQEPKICRFCRVRSFSGSHFQGPCGFPGFPAAAEGRCAQILSGRQQHEPRISPGGATKSSKFGDSLEGCAHPKGQIDFDQPPLKAGVPRFRPGGQQQEPEELWRSMWPFSGGHILEKGPPPRSAKNVLQALYLMTKFNVAKSGLDF